MLHTIHCPGRAQRPGIETLIHSRKIIKQIELFDQERDGTVHHPTDYSEDQLQKEYMHSINHRRLI